jgi:hypothetical protein
LTKIGSLIALSRIFVLFSYYHEWLFEKKLAQETKEALQDNEALGTSTEVDSKLLAEVQVREFYTFQTFLEMHQAFRAKLPKKGLNHTTTHLE